MLMCLLIQACWLGGALPVSAQKVDPRGPAQVGRTEVVGALDHLADEELAGRRMAVEAIRTKEDAVIRQRTVREKILGLLGEFPSRTPLNARTVGVTQAAGFRIEKVVFESQPQFFVTALLYLPDGASNTSPRAAILVAPGHSAAGKASDYFTAATLARNGFAVLSYDPIGQGERLQYPDPAKPGSSLAGSSTGEHGEASLQPMLLGDAIARFFAWDAMRAVDYLATRPEIDAVRIGAFGCSGGGAMTALTAALDPRIAAAAVACYNTSFDALLGSIGPQDGEQSIPGFVAAGLGFPDWIELVAPRPYAAVATYGDMFPFAGTVKTVQEARHFYALFDLASGGTPKPEGVPVPEEPALNMDSSSPIPATAHLQFVTGPGGHGALAPILSDLVSFFLRNLQPGADAEHPKMTASPPRGSPTGLPAKALQVTETGQVATSFPGAASVFTLNQARAKEVLPARPSAQVSVADLQERIRVATHASALPGTDHTNEGLRRVTSGPLELESGSGVTLRGRLSVPDAPGRHPAVLLLVPEPLHADTPAGRAALEQVERLSGAGNVVLALTPSPSPAGTDEMKSPLLGPFYLLSLRADLVGRTLVGLRTDDVVHAVDYLASRPDVDARQISARGSGHMGLVLLHAGVLDSRLSRLTVDRVLESYRSLLAAPLPTGAPEDVIPGILRLYDLPDLVGSLGSRLTLSVPLKGTDDLSQTSTPIETLRTY